MSEKILDHIEILEKFNNSAKKDQEEAKKKLEEADKLYQITSNLIIYSKKKWLIHLKTLIESEMNFFVILKDKYPDAASVLEELYEYSKQETITILKRFPAHFEKACKEAELDIDPTSRHPRYRVCESFLEIEILEKTEKARIFDREGMLEEITCDIGAIIEALKFHKERLFDREFNGQNILSNLQKQYESVIKLEKMQEGDSIPIRRITTRMGKNVKGFRADEFLIDISRLVKENVLVIDGQKLDFQQTKDSKKGMLLHGLEDRGYIGFINFKRGVN